MINSKYHHYDLLETFQGKKFSASPDDSSYTYGGEGEIYQGEPDISWRSIVFIKDAGLICTHGRIYDASGKSENLKTPVKVNGSEFDGSEGIVTEKWGKSREMSISDGINESSPVLVNGKEDITLLLPETINSRVVRDSYGRVITDTYPTKDELHDSIEGLTNFFVYSGDDDSDPTLSNLPASEWNTPELLELHSGDYYVTSKGRVFYFEESPESGWGWTEITDHYLYDCLEELRDLKKKVNISVDWGKTQYSVEEGEIYVSGRKETKPYLDVISCPGFINYKLSGDTNLYFPFIDKGDWVRTLTRNTRELKLVTISDLSGISGKIITVVNEKSSLGKIRLILSSTKDINIYPGEICILRFFSEIKDEGITFYWEASEIGKIENSDWI